MPISDKERQEWTFHPRKPGERVKTRLEQFDFLNTFVTARGGWVTSLPGAVDVTVEALPGATLPSELRAGGAKVTTRNGSMTLPAYKLDAAGEGQRILPTAIVADVLTEGSTVPIRMQHAGIVTVKRFTFNMN